VLDLPYIEDHRAQVDLNVVANADGNIIEVQGTAEGAPMKRSELDQLIDLALEGIAELSVRQAQVLRKADVDLDKLLGR
jgi:ribonuclease PH